MVTDVIAVQTTGIIFALNYFPGFPFAVTILSLLLGAGTISFMGHKCFVLSTQNLPSSYCAFPVYYKVLQPHPVEFALKLPLFLVFLTFSQFCFSSPRSVTAENLVMKFSCLTHSLTSIPSLASFGFPCSQVLLSCPLCSIISLWFTPACIGFKCLLCLLWMLDFKLKCLSFHLCRFFKLFHAKLSESTLAASCYFCVLLF